MQISARFDGMTQLLDNLGQHARQIPYATELAINACAWTTRKATQVMMRAEFDRPTPFMMRGIYVDPAQYKQGKLWAEVKVFDNASPSLADVVGHQFSGGASRLRQRFENALERNGYIRAGEYVAPGPDAKLDAYGNLSRGQLQQIYAALRLFSDRYQNPTDSKRSQKHARAAGRMFWSHGQGHSSKLRRGLWGTAPDGGVRLILVVISSVKYKRRIDLPRLAEIQVRRDFRNNFEKAMARAIGTAR